MSGVTRKHHFLRNSDCSAVIYPQGLIESYLHEMLRAHKLFTLTKRQLVVTIHIESLLTSQSNYSQAKRLQMVNRIALLHLFKPAVTK